MNTACFRQVNWGLKSGLWVVLATALGCSSSGKGLAGVDASGTPTPDGEVPPEADATMPSADLSPGEEDAQADTLRADSATSDAGRADTGRADTGRADVRADGGADTGNVVGRGFSATSPFLVYYDTAESMGDLSAVANKFRIIDIDVDPGLGNFTKEQVTQLKGGGKNRVLGYMNLGACEDFRVYWSTVPTGFVSCSANKAGQLGPYDGWDNEMWMNLGNADYQKLVLEHMAPNVASLGVDGFYFDNLDVVERGSATSAQCNAACVQGALDTVRKLREKYPSFVFVMQNAAGEQTLEGTTGGVSFTSLIDGIVGENTFTPLPNGDPSLLADLLLWKNLNLKPGGNSFFIGTLEYVSNCNDATNIGKVVTLGNTNGFTSYVSLESLSTICPYWLP